MNSPVYDSSLCAWHGSGAAPMFSVGSESDLGLVASAPPAQEISVAESKAGNPNRGRGACAARIGALTAVVLLLLLTTQTVLGEGSPDETGDAGDSGDVVDVGATLGTGVKFVVYGLAFVALCVVSTAVPDAPLLFFVFSMPILQFDGLRVALAVLQCAIVVVRTGSLWSLLPSWFLSVFLFCIVASSTWALDPAASFLSKSDGVVATLSYVPLVMATRALLRSGLTSTHRLLSVLSLGCIPGCMLILYNAHFGIQWRNAGYRMALLRPDIFSPLLVVSGMFLLFCVTAPAVSRGGRLASLALLPLICIALLLTGIRSGWLAFGLGGCFWLWRARSILGLGGALTVAAVVGLVAIGTAANLHLEDQLDTRLSEQSMETGASRLELWEVAARGFVERPVLGIGWGCFPGFAADNTIGREIIAHNIFMRILCELGLVGLAVFFAWIAATIFRLRRSSERGLMALLMIGVLTQGLLLDLFVCTYFYLFLGMCDGVLEDKPDRDAAQPERWNWAPTRRINRAAL